MIPAPTPSNEASRQRALTALDILDSPAEERFDRLTRLARKLFAVDAAVVSLVDADRQWFKSIQGMALRQTPRDVSFCGHAILDDRLMVVEDASRDERFHDNPLVVGAPNLRFYAGRPLRTPDGHRVGAFCIAHGEPRRLDEDEVGLLHELASMAERELVRLSRGTIDPVTGLTNSHGFCELGEHALQASVRAGTGATAVVLRLDSYDCIRADFGSVEATAALKGFAELARDVFGGPDIVARTGAQSISVLITDSSDAEILARLRRLEALGCGYNARVAQPYALAFSAGTARYSPQLHANVHDLLASAERTVSPTGLTTAVLG
jgi:GGDEF domain-containing protein